MRTIRGVFAATLTAGLGAASPALADCTQSGLIVTCAANSPAGFTAGAGVNGLTLQVLPGATVGNTITLNDGNAVSNLGTVSVGSTNAMVVGDNNTLVNSGTLASGAETAVIFGKNAVVTNTGTIVSAGWGALHGGDTSSADGAGLSFTNSGTVTSGYGVYAEGRSTIVNTGTMTAGDYGTPASIVGNDSVIINSGHLETGAHASTTSIFGNRGTITNTGTMTAGYRGNGIEILGHQNVAFNSGSIEVGDSGAAIIGSGTRAMVTNSGTLKAGANGFGISLDGDRGVTVNSGSIEAGAIGMFISGDQATITNTGTIKAGDAGYGLYIRGWTGVATNAGLIEVGLAGTGMIVDRLSTATNTGTIRSTALAAYGMLGLEGSTLVNRGTIALGDSGVGIQAVLGNVLNTGSVTVGGASEGIGGNGIQAFGDNIVVTNGAGGTIAVGAYGTGIWISGSSATLTNDGSIATTEGGEAILFDATSGTLVNNGTIVAGMGGFGINESRSTDSRIVNTGRIDATAPYAVAVMLGDNPTFTNSGTIVAGTNGYTLYQSGYTRATVVNTGTLDGPLYLNGMSGTTVENSGLITISAPWTGAVQHLIEGTFTQTAAGTLALRVTPNGMSDSLGVYNTQPGTGIANLGGTLRALLQPGLYANTTTYAGALTFATSTGRFASVASSSPFFTAAAVYNAESVDLVLTRIPFGQAAGLGATANGRAIGAALEAGYSPNLTGIAATAYGKLLASTSPSAIAQLAGEVATAASTGSFSAFGQFFAVTSSQSDTARNSTSGNPGGNRVALAFASDADACIADSCDTPLPFGRRVTAWAQGFGSGGSVDGNAATGSARVDMSAGGGAVGIDVQLTSRSLLGLSLGTTSSGYSLGGTSSYGSGRAILFGVYGSFTGGPAYLDAALGYGTGTYTTTRVVSTGTIAEQLTASFDGQQYGGRVEAGWRFETDRATLTPFAGLMVQAFRQSGYSETARDLETGGPGALGLAVQGQTTTSVRSFLGAEARASFTLGDGSVFSPRLRAAWAHEYNPARSMTAALATLAPASTFTVQGAGAAVDALVLGAGFDLALTPRVKLFAQFDGDLAANARSFAGTGGVKLTW